MSNHIFNRPLKILLSTNALIFIASAMFGPIYALFVEGIGGDILDASLAGAIFALSAGTVTLLSGKYVDKVKEEVGVIATPEILFLDKF